jgi:PAS domain S-box-containing protein
MMMTPSLPASRLPNGAAPETLIGATGEMASLVRAHNWNATPLGPLERWSETLLALVNVVLASPIPTVFNWGPELILIYNDAYRLFLGDKHPRSLGQPAHLVWVEAWHHLTPRYEFVLRTGEPISEENSLISIYRNGHLEDCYWSYSFSPIYEDGRIAGIFNAAQDSTESVLAARERDKLAEQLNQVLEVTTDSILSIDREWRITYLNPPAKEISSPSGDVLGKNFWESFPSAVYEGSPYVQHYHRAMNEHVTGEFDAFYPEPLNIWVRVQVRPASDGIILFFRDITEQKRATAALMQTEKLAAVGRLAASIAHEINNPLESVTNLLYLARSSEDATEIQNYLDIAERELRRVSVISNQTLRFYKQSTSPRPVTCEDLFESVLSIYQGRIVNSRVTVEKRKRTKKPVLCFEGEIRQVLNNLVGNAIDAMHPAGGRLLVRSREATNWKTGQRGLSLTVADTGPGMSPSVMKKMFDAFFTTKGIGGTGLGLWVSKDIVDRHEGLFLVRSSQKKNSSGTVFTLFLPFAATIR